LDGSIAFQFAFSPREISFSLFRSTPNPRRAYRSTEIRRSGIALEVKQRNTAANASR
jgi:hypothetical protein